MKKIHLEDLFFDHFAKFSEREQKTIYRKLELLQNNPEHNSLRTQKLRGTYKNWRESSVSMGIRVIWRYNEDGDVILVEDVGRHDILKKYG
jgi:mRNA-degrading endonuclease YafQ of YafQ-DinJ toxin-antitoxin module